MMADTSTLQLQTAVSQDVPQLPTWREMNWDTSPEMDAVLFKLWRETPAWRKLELMEGLNRAARQLALMGIRQRFPDALPEEQQRRLASIRLGTELAERVYGRMSGKEDGC
ncbi:MAG TPA: hypothetical protein PLD25_31085 [Chloroflexota bacterium]|nr:hypothetical protein [Chloroflexota bacterium]HUM67694.1 hypothetical protein [Chloroflexota bacterium]